MADLPRYYWEWRHHLARIYDRRRSHVTPIAEAIGADEAEKIVEALNRREKADGR